MTETVSPYDHRNHLVLINHFALSLTPTKLFKPKRADYQTGFPALVP